METSLKKVVFVLALVVGCGGDDDSHVVDSREAGVVADAGSSVDAVVDAVVADSGAVPVADAPVADAASEAVDGGVVASVDAGSADGATDGLGALSLDGLVADRAALDFGGVAVGVTSPIQVVTFRNMGASATGTPMLNLSGVSADAFVFTSTCSGPLAPAESCTAAVIFAPTGPGSASATLTAFDSDAAIAVSLTAVGTTPPSL